MAWYLLNLYLSSRLSKRLEVLNDILNILLARVVLWILQLLNCALIISKYNRFPTRRTILYRQVQGEPNTIKLYCVDGANSTISYVEANLLSFRVQYHRYCTYIVVYFTPIAVDNRLVRQATFDFIPPLVIEVNGFFLSGCYYRLRWLPLGVDSVGGVPFYSRLQYQAFQSIQDILYHFLISFQGAKLPYRSRGVSSHSELQDFIIDR